MSEDYSCTKKNTEKEFYEIFDDTGKNIEGIRGVTSYKDALVIFTEKGIFCNDKNLFQCSGNKESSIEESHLEDRLDNIERKVERIRWDSLSDSERQLEIVNATNKKK